jgi:hypothetical protein
MKWKASGLTVRAWRCPPLSRFRLPLFRLTEQLPLRSTKVMWILTGVYWFESACTFRLRGVFEFDVEGLELLPPHLADWTCRYNP